jgi:hypothetical protein
MEMEVTKRDAVILLNIWLFNSTNVVLLDKKNVIGLGLLSS